MTLHANSAGASDDSKLLISFCMDSLENLKAHNLVNIDVKKNSSITDYMLICTGTSNRHVCAIADRLVENLSEKGIKGVTVSGENTGEWVVVDTGNVMVHIMQEEVRKRYCLEDLYRCIAAGEEEAQLQ